MASPFASLVVSDAIPMPGDPEQWVRVRKLTGKQHEQAQEEHRAEFVRGEKWASVFRAAMEQGPSASLVQSALADPLTGYDRYTLVRLGLVAWSYPQSVKPVTVKSTVEGEPDLVVDAIEDLDDDAIEFIAREVLKLTKPGLFVPVDAAPEEQKKD